MVAPGSNVVVPLVFKSPQTFALSRSSTEPMLHRFWREAFTPRKLLPGLPALEAEACPVPLDSTSDTASLSLRLLVAPTTTCAGVIPAGVTMRKVTSWPDEPAVPVPAAPAVLPPAPAVPAEPPPPADAPLLPPLPAAPLLPP